MDRCKFSLICLIFVSFVVLVRSQITGVNICDPKIPCDDSQCIERDRWCDEVTDCLDESDEKYCQTKGWFRKTVDNNCNDERHFECDSKKCVPKVLKCDGFDDCWDKSDELFCESEEDGKSSESSENSSFNEIESNRSKEPTTTVPGDLPPAPITRISILPRPRVSTVNYYDERMAEVSNQPNIYHLNGQSRTRYNAASDIIPDFNSFQPTISTYETNTRSRGIHLTDTRIPIPNSFSTPRHWPVLHRPRVAIFAPAQIVGFQPVYNNFNNRRSVVLQPFHFERNYNQLFRNKYKRGVSEAREWLIKQRDSSFSWGKDTPRALVALSLISNTFPSNLTENELMKKRLKIDLGIKLIRRREKPLSISRLAMYINALIATCQDPRNTFDQDLVEMLRNQVQTDRRADMSPFPYITLCLANSYLTQEDFSFLENIVKASITDEITKDKFILATSALACYKKVYPSNDELEKIVEEAFHKLQQQQLDDDSFGSLYSTAIAAQALIAIDSRSWNPDSTINYLANKQLHNGSFGDLLATYYTLPVLSGRSLVHLRNTQCELPIEGPTPPVIDDWWNVPGPKKRIVYSLATDYRQTSSIGLELDVPVDRNFFDVMQMAQHFDARFKFLYKEHIQIFDVYTINNIPNDPERGTYWNLYVLDRTNVTVDTSQRYKNDIRILIPQDSQELLFWYLPFKPY